MTCIPNEPFSFILGENRLKSITKDTATKTKSTELQSLQGLEANLGVVSDGMREMPSEPYTVAHNTLIYKEKSCSEKQLIKTGWGGWIRTNECRHQKPMPYHLATPQSQRSCISR